MKISISNHRDLPKAGSMFFTFQNFNNISSGENLSLISAFLIAFNNLQLYI